MPRAGPLFAWNWHFAWAGVFSANLIVPLWLGWEITRNGGRVGMFIAIAVLLASSLLALSRRPELRKSVVAGGVFTALTQVLPLVQMAAGLLSLSVVDQCCFEAGGFLVTILTAGLLLVAALACGVIIRATGRAVDRQIERKVR